MQGVLLSMFYNLRSCRKHHNAIQIVAIRYSLYVSSVIIVYVSVGSFAMVISDTEFLMKRIQLLNGVNISNYCTECDGKTVTSTFVK